MKPRPLCAPAVGLLIFAASAVTYANSVGVYRTELNIPYCAVDGRTQTLNAFLPVNVQGPVPAMVEIHGGWWSGGAAASKPQGVDGWQIFMRHNLAIFSIRYRLGKEGGFPENIRDCRNAIRFIRKNALEFNIDPNRIDVCGGSAGGHLSLMVAMVPEDFDDGGPTAGLAGISAKVSGSFSYIPPTDFLRFWSHSDTTIGSVESQRRLRVLFHGIIPDTAAHKVLYNEMSPIGYVRKDVPPLLICDGEKDPIVPGLEGKDAGMMSTYIKKKAAYVFK